jgi:hypothetical protein
MQDDVIQLPKTFPPAETSVTRVIRGVPGSSLVSREITDLVNVTWGRTTSSTVEIHINGVFVDHRIEYCDGGELGSSLAHAMEEWQELVDDYGAGKDDRFEVSLVSWIKDVPTLGYAKDDVFGRKCYSRLPKLGSAFFLNVPEAGIGSLASEDLKTLDVVCHSRTKVMSSLWSKEANEAAMVAYLLRIEEETRTESDAFQHYG